MWTAYQSAASTANPDDPALATYATGTALTTLTNGLKSIRDRGLVAKGQFVLTPQVTLLEPADAPKKIEITDCADSTSFLLYRSTGELADDDPGGRRRILATAQDIGEGTWKVVSFGVREVGTC
jgi:hypothetical protein